MNDVWQDLETVAAQLKHDPDRVDPDGLRQLVRRAQVQVATVACLRRPLRVTVEDVSVPEWAEHEVTLVVRTDDVVELVRALLDPDWGPPTAEDVSVVAQRRDPAVAVKLRDDTGELGLPAEVADRINEQLESGERRARPRT